MEEKVDIVALGELLIDFTEAGHSQDGRNAYHSGIKRITLGMPVMEENKNMQVARYLSASE